MTSNSNNNNDQKEPETLDLSKKLTLDRIVVKDGGFAIDGSDKATSGTRVFVRVDFNVPLSNELVIRDDTRIRMTLPTLEHILSLNPSRLVLSSHLGRPKGNVVAKMSLEPVARRLEELLKRKVQLVTDWFRPDDSSFDLDAHLGQYESGTVLLLENARFYVEEEGKGLDAQGEKVKANAERVAKFRAVLTSLCDLYVNDAFGTCHRAHSTMVGVAAPLKCAGLLVRKELEYFDRALSKPERPYLAILGGAKVSDKILVIESLLDKVDEMIIAGGMCFTFIKQLQKVPIGASLFDEEGAKIVQKIMDKATERNIKIILPVDFVCGSAFSNDCEVSTVDISGDGREAGIPDGIMGLDVGPKSVALIQESILKSKTVVFNGPPGVFELENFSNGTKSMVSALVETTKGGAVTIVGGGDSASAVNKYGAAKTVSHVSTGGGASLELLEGKLLPGVVALSDI